VTLAYDRPTRRRPNVTDSPGGSCGRPLERPSKVRHRFGAADRPVALMPTFAPGKSAMRLEDTVGVPKTAICANGAAPWRGQGREQRPGERQEGRQQITSAV
jgi:hypothetical protein